MTLLTKYYKVAALLPFVVNLLLGLVLSATHDGSNYKSESSTSDGFVLTVFLTILLSGFITIISLTIYLNNKLAIKSNTIYSFIVWVGLAGSLCIYVIYQEVINFSSQFQVNNVYEGSRLIDGYILFMALLHLFMLLATFLNFKIYSI
jgi:hypothetical protein